MPLFKKLKFSQPVLYLVAIILALISGLSEAKLLQELAFALSKIFIQIFQFVSLPLISLSIIVTILNYSKSAMMQQIWQKTIKYTVFTTLIAATTGCLLYLLISPELVVQDTGLNELNIANTSFLAHLNSLIPSNIFAPFIKHQVMSVLLISFVIGFAVKQVEDEKNREVLKAFFCGIHAAFIVITKWIVAVIPFGLYGFMTTTIVQLKSGMTFKGIGQYLLVIVLANLVQGLLLLPLWLKSRGLKPFVLMKAMMPALSLAFFSKSSVGTLPVTMNSIEEKLDVKPEVSRFVLPLCTSINMNGCAAFIFVTVIYLMQNSGVHLSLPLMGLWVLIATIAALGNAGVPMGCFFISTSLLVSMNIPITLMGVILPFYSLIDMLETALNVWSDVCVTKVVNDESQEQGAVVVNEIVET